MANFQTLQTRVQSNVIDLPPAVLAQVPNFVNSAIQFLEALHNFQVMKAEVSYITPNVADGQTHVLGGVPPQWKEPRGEPYLVRQIGSARGITWQPSREYMYRKWQAYSVYDIGEPRDLLLSEALPAQFGLFTGGNTDPAGSVLGDGDSPGDNTWSSDLTSQWIEVYPYPDGASDWPNGNYRIQIPYWMYVPNLTKATDTNWFTKDGPGAEYIIAAATMMSFEMDWDEARASFWRNNAFGPKWDGASVQSLGGLGRMLMNLDKGLPGTPSKTLIPRRDVFASRDQWRA